MTLRIAKLDILNDGCVVCEEGPTGAVMYAVDIGPGSSYARSQLCARHLIDLANRLAAVVGPLRGQRESRLGSGAVKR